MKVAINVKVNNTLNVSSIVAIKSVINVENKVVIPQGGGMPYSGVYEVIPSIDPQTLLTKNRLMEDDIQVKAIPYYETTYNQNGKTIYIG